jgi:hypothetical protein
MGRYDPGRADQGPSVADAIFADYGSVGNPSVLMDYLRAYLRIIRGCDAWWLNTRADYRLAR